VALDEVTGGYDWIRPEPVVQIVADRNAATKSKVRRSDLPQTELSASAFLQGVHERRRVRNHVTNHVATKKTRPMR
jgi:hypothetical protein